MSVANEARRYLSYDASQFASMKRQLRLQNDDTARAGLFYAINRMGYSGLTKHGGASPACDRFTADGVRALGEFRNALIEVRCADFRDSMSQHPESFAFLDPPYVEADRLYDGHHTFDHCELLTCLKDRDNWIMTYDDCEPIQSRYEGFPIKQYDVRYSLSNRIGKEVIIGSKNMAAALGVTIDRPLYMFTGEKPNLASPTTPADHWRHVGTYGRIAEKMALARLAIDDVINGSQRLAIVVGAPGVGKSELARNAMQQFDRRGTRAIFGKPSSKLHLEELLIASRGRYPLILDEADILFRSSPMIELLKLVTDCRAPSYIAGQGGRRIPITAPIILLGNFQLRDLARNQQNQAKALFDRHAPVEIDGSCEELYDWTVYLALSSELVTSYRFNSRGLATSLDDVAHGIEWFRKNLWNLKSVSPRTLQKVTGWHMLHRRGLQLSARELELRLSSLLLDFPQTPDVPPEFSWAELRLALSKSNPTARPQLAA